jgi:sec-independent protein translocase protein TatA
MVGMQELILILVILLLVFGPSKLPKMARDLGKAWNEFNKASSHIKGALNSTMNFENKSENQVILNFANKLGLDITGKTEKQITDMVLSKIINSEKTSN